MQKLMTEIGKGTNIQEAPRRAPSNPAKDDEKTALDTAAAGEDPAPDDGVSVLETETQSTLDTDTPATEIGINDDAASDAPASDIGADDIDIAPPPPPPPPPPVEVPNTLVSYGPFGFVIGTEGMDVILAYGFRTLAFGGGGDDTMMAFGGTAYFRGGDGQDTLIGGNMADTLFGDDGDDRLLVGNGDFAVGGAGADQFIFSTTDKGTVRVSDFDASEGDMLVFNTTGTVTYDVIDNINNTAISFSDGMTIELYGVTAQEVLAAPDLFGL